MSKLKNRLKTIFKILSIGCLGMCLIFLVFLFMAFYPVLFPDTPEEIERKNIELEEELKEEIEDKEMDDYINEFNIKPNHNNPNFDPLISEFKNQRDRFIFNKCEFSYNENNFYLEDSLEHITSIFGKPDESNKIVTYRYPKGRIKFIERSYTEHRQSMQEDVYVRKTGLSIYQYPDDSDYGESINSLEGEENSTTFSELKQLKTNELNKLQEKYKDSLIELSDEIILTYEILKIAPKFHRDTNTKQYLLTELSIDLDLIRYFDPNTPFKVIMFRGIPYKLSTEMYDFLDLSNLKRKDLDYHRLYIYENDCAKSSKKIIYTKMESKPYFETSGGGHLTWTGPYDPEKSLSIEYITFSIHTLQDLKNIEMKEAGLLD